MDETPDPYSGGPSPDMTVDQAAVMGDAFRCILAWLRREPRWLRSDDCREHFIALTDALGQVASESLIAAAEARGLGPDEARADATAEIESYLARTDLVLIENGASLDDPRFTVRYPPEDAWPVT